MCTHAVQHSKALCESIVRTGLLLIESACALHESSACMLMSMSTDMRIGRLVGCLNRNVRLCCVWLCSTVLLALANTLNVLQNAYNLPAEIQPYAIVGTPVDGGCGTPICTISDIASFCQFPNVDGGNYCTNTDGPGLVPTAGTEMFKSACPDAYSYSKDDSSSTYACPTGTNYYFRYCP